VTGGEMTGNAPDGLLRHPALMVAAAGVAMAEAGLLLAFAPAARALAPQVTAVAPLAVFHDLRWLYGFGGAWAGSLLGFWAALVALVTARTLLNAVLVRLAWPRDAEPPSLLVLLRTGSVATVLVIVVLSPLATLAFGVAVLPFSWPLLASLPVLLLLTALLSHAGVAGGWWQLLPPARVAAWALASFLVLSAAAAVIGWLPDAWAVPVAGLAGLFNARAWRGVTAALTARQLRPRRLPRVSRLLPVAPLAVVIAVALVIGSLRLTFSAAGGSQRASAVSLRAQPGPGPSPRAGTAPVAPHGTAASGTAASGTAARGTAARGTPLLEIAGFGSSCCAGSAGLRALSPDGIVRRFSYRGLSAAGQPLPYGRAASNLPLATLGNRIAAQVWRLHDQTGQPVDIVAESEGTLGVYAMLARHPRVPLGAVVLLSPILAPGQVSYPDHGGEGSGMAPGYELQAVVRFIGGLSPYGASGAQELIGSVDRTGARFAHQAIERIRRDPMHWLNVVPLADAVTLPACTLPAHTVVVPAWHGALATDAAVQRIVRAFLAGRPVRTQPDMTGAAETVAAAAAAWRIPEPAESSPPCGAS
jgi:hypothetical protein